MIQHNELILKYGSLVQFGVDYMAGFSPFADLFLEKFYEYKPVIDSQGFSIGWNNWRTDNSADIIALYDALEGAGLIPTEPISGI
jgi:hypothetical protein